MIYHVSKSRLIFMNVMITLIGLACLGASIAQVITWLQPNHAGGRGGGLVLLSPVFGLMLFWGVRSLLTLPGKDLRLEADAEGVVWTSVRGKKWAKWTSLDPFTADNRRKVVIATVIGSDASPDVLAAGAFSISAQLLDRDENELAVELDNLRRRALRC